MDGLVGDVIGGLCLAVGVGLGLVALWAERTRRVARDLATEPTRYLYTATSVARYGGRTAIGVSGTIVSAPTLRAPMTQRPCVLWDLALFREDYGGEYPEWNPVWADKRVQDLEIAHDVRRDHDEARPPPDRPYFVPGPGTVEIDGDRIVIESLMVPPSRDVEVVEVEPTAETLPLLQDLGVPQKLLQGIATEPRRYRLAEASLDQGAFVQCAQEHPDANFLLFAGSIEEHTIHYGSCAAKLFLAASLFMLLLGWALMAGD